MNYKKYERILNYGITKCPVESAAYMLIHNFLDDLYEYEETCVISAVGLRKKRDLRLDTLGGISDIYIVSNDFKYQSNEGECFGCVEIKSPTEKLIYGDQIFYQKKTYSNVIYTNGIIWEFYKDSILEWDINLSDGALLFSLVDININHVKYYELIKKLLDIKWK